MLPSARSFRFASLCLLVSLLSADRARGTVLVDNFNTAQNLAIAPGTSSSDGGVAAGGTAIGGARWASLGTAGGVNPLGSSYATFNDSSDGIMALTPNADDDILTTLIYDGDYAGSHLSVDAVGLGGVNLTATGDLTFQLTARSTTAVDGVLFLYSYNSSSYYRYDFTFPGLGVDVPYSAINLDVYSPTFTTGVGFTPNSLGAVVLTIDTQVTSGLVQIDTLRFVPEPSSLVLLGCGLCAMLLGRRSRRR